MGFDTDNDLESQYEEIDPDDLEAWGDESTVSDEDFGDNEDELSQEFVDKLIDKIMAFGETFTGRTLHSYQLPFARRVIESILVNDGSEITALAARQSGKSEIIGFVMSTLMVLLPRLAAMYPDLLGKFKDGVWIGMFAPVETMAETLYGRTVNFLTSERANEVLGDPEIDDITARTPGVTKGMKLTKSGSTLLMMTANPRAKIESKSFHIIIIDEAQDSDDFVVSKSISPMGAYYNATIVKTGTPTTTKNNFYRAIQLNKRLQTGRRARQNHFQWDWKDVAKVNPNYEKFIKKEMLRIGEDSDEFLLSYCPTPETRILTADLRHVPAGEVKVGDKLVGFDEERPGKGLHRKFREAVVEDVGRLILPCYTMTLSDDTVVTCSGDHQWLVSTAGRRTVWKRTADLVATDRIFKATDVWETADSYDAGYLAAAFDGEGSLARRTDGQVVGLTMAQKPNAMLAHVEGVLTREGVQYGKYDNNVERSGVHHVSVKGGGAAIAQFLGKYRPKRLLDKFRVDDMGSIGRHDHKATDFRHPSVVSVEFVGDREVVAIKTSTKTYVAEGLASHNCCRWLLERGMFVSSSVLDHTSPSTLGDLTMETVKIWQSSPCVVGIDPARKSDSTVVTVMWVDWDRPDEFGYYEHRILNWLEIQGDDWEEQYYQIVNFLSNYDVLAVAVDANGVGDAVAQRLKLLLPRADVIPVTSSASEQSARYKHLQALIQRKMLSWPAHAKSRRLRTYRRFVQQMGDAEVTFKGPNFSVEAPDEAHAHDDYVDSLSLAASLTKDLIAPQVETSNNFFYAR
jgi:hypothetical protein